MAALNFLRHLFIPHYSNNQKARIIHTEILAFITLLLFGYQLVLGSFPKNLPAVLGYAANISPGEIINLTNKERASRGLSLLSENKTLDSAALAKGQDMISKGYWAHFAPDGTSPWVFFSRFGYKYQYAGENLARDFPDATAAVAAWMNSPSHRDNILNPHYREIGIGVVDGSLAGVETTIVVQFFGSPQVVKPSIPVAKADQSGLKEVQQLTVENLSPAAEPAPPESVKPNDRAERPQKFVVSPFQSTKDLSLLVIGVLLLVLSIDLIIVKKRRISRIGGRTLAHISYLSMVLAAILLLRAGRII